MTDKFKLTENARGLKFSGGVVSGFCGSGFSRDSFKRLKSIAAEAAPTTHISYMEFILRRGVGRRALL